MSASERVWWGSLWRTTVVLLGLGLSGFILGREDAGWWTLAPAVLVAWLLIGRWALRR